MIVEERTCATCGGHSKVKVTAPGCRDRVVPCPECSYERFRNTKFVTLTVEISGSEVTAITDAKGLPVPIPGLLQAIAEAGWQ